MDGRHLMRGPVVGKRLDVRRGNAAFLLGPLGRLGLPIGTAKHVILEPVEAIRMSGDVILVVGALPEPGPRDGKPKRGIGVGKNRNPLVGVNGGTIVEVGADVDLLDADLGPEVADLRRHLATPTPRSRLRVAAHADDGIGVLADVPEQVRLVCLLANRIHAPHVLCAPIPAFPAIGLASLQRKASEKVHEVRVAAMARVHDLRLPMTVALAEHRRVAIGVDDAANLVRANLGGLVPADALVTGNATVLRIALPVRIPVDALQRVRHAVVRVDALLVAYGHRRQRRDEATCQRVAAHLDLPGIDFVFGVLVIEMKRADTRDASVLHVDGSRVRPRAESTPSGGLVHGLVSCPSHLTPLVEPTADFVARRFR